MNLHQTHYNCKIPENICVKSRQVHFTKNSQNHEGCKTNICLNHKDTGLDYTCSRASTASPLAIASALRGLPGSSSKLDMILLKLLDWAAKTDHAKENSKGGGLLRETRSKSETVDLASLQCRHRAICRVYAGPGFVSQG